MPSSSAYGRSSALEPVPRRRQTELCPDPLGAETEERAEFLEGIGQSGLEAEQLVDHRLHADHGDEHAQDVVGSFADHVEPGVAHHPFIGFIAKERLPAEDLDRVVDDRPQGIGGPDLEHGGFQLDVATAVDEGSALVDRGFHGEGVGRHVGDLLLDQLEFAQRLLELHPLLGMGGGRFEADLGHAGTAGPEGDPAVVQRIESDLQPLAELTEEILRRHRHVVEGQPSGGRAADPHFRHACFQHFEAGHIRSHEKRADLGLAAARPRGSGP